MTVIWILAALLYLLFRVGGWLAFGIGLGTLALYVLIELITKRRKK